MNQISKHYVIVVQNLLKGFAYLRPNEQCAIYLKDFIILLHFRERERAPASVDYKTLTHLCSYWMRHILVNMGRRAPASRDFKLKARLHSYWSRHFQQNMGSRAKLNMPSFLLVAPFSTDSIFITYDLYLDLRFVLILNYKHVRTAGLSVYELKVSSHQIRST